jgi:hypothetical protein
MILVKHFKMPSGAPRAGPNKAKKPSMCVERNCEAGTRQVLQDLLSRQLGSKPMNNYPVFG